VRFYLLENVVELLVGRLGAESQPVERVVLVVAEQFVERLRDVPAELRRVVVSHQHDVRPAVHVGDHLERTREAAKRPGDAHHRIVGRRIMDGGVGTPLRKERTVPVGHDVPGSNTHCIRQHTTGL